MSITPSNRIAMSHAIKIAQNPDVPLGPNPRVGCVLVDESGEYLSQGFHRGRGTDHAEVAAIKNAKGDLTKATAIVTLEPCSRKDRDSDCTRAIVSSGIKRVIFAQRDTTPRSSGASAILEENGVEVIDNLMEEEASGINPWLSIAMSQQRPYLRLKIASTLDGKVATASGKSKWITNELSRSYVHKLRRESHVLLSSIRTANLDEARFTARGEDGLDLPEQPIVCLVGSEEITPNHPIFDNERSVLFFKTHDLRELLQNLWQEQHLSVLVEAGPRLSTALIKEQLVNELLWFTSSMIIGSDGLDAIGDLDTLNISESIQPHLKFHERFGTDFLSIYQLSVGN